MRAFELNQFISAREDIFFARQLGKPKPWTKDSILQRFRFCNVERENDTVTKWIAENWRELNSAHEDLWFAMSVARWINWPDTLDAIGFPLPWRPAQVVKAMKARQARKEKVWTGAYMIGTQGNAVDKPKFIVEKVLGDAYRNRAYVRPREGDTLAAFAGRLMEQYAFKGFMTGQVVADLKYAADSPLLEASDWMTWAASGPGSRRGLARVFNRDKDVKIKETLWHADLMKLQAVINNARQLQRRNLLHAQDLQNCLCEFDKYERVRLNQGRPRSLYQGV
jgi:hypothetical protein